MEQTFTVTVTEMAGLDILFPTLGHAASTTDYIPLMSESILVVSPLSPTELESPDTIPSTTELTLGVRPLSPTELETPEIFHSANEPTSADHHDPSSSAPLRRPIPEELKQFLITPDPHTVFFKVNSTPPSTYLSTLRNPRLPAEHHGMFLYMSPGLGNASDAYLRYVDNQYHSLSWQSQQFGSEDYHAAEEKMDKIKRAMPTMTRMVERDFQRKVIREMEREVSRLEAEAEAVAERQRKKEAVRLEAEKERERANDNRAGEENMRGEIMTTRQKEPAAVLGRREPALVFGQRRGRRQRREPAVVMKPRL